MKLKHTKVEVPSAVECTLDELLEHLTDQAGFFGTVGGREIEGAITIRYAKDIRPLLPKAVRERIVTLQLPAPNAITVPMVSDVAVSE